MTLLTSYLTHLRAESWYILTLLVISSEDEGDRCLGVKVFKRDHPKFSPHQGTWQKLCVCPEKNAPFLRMNFPQCFTNFFLSHFEMNTAQVALQNESWFLDSFLSSHP